MVGVAQRARARVHGCEGKDAARGVWASLGSGIGGQGAGLRPSRPRRSVPKLPVYRRNTHKGREPVPPAEKTRRRSATQAARWHRAAPRQAQESQMARGGAPRRAVGSLLPSALREPPQEGLACSAQPPCDPEQGQGPGSGRGVQRWEMPLLRGQKHRHSNASRSLLRPRTPTKPS